MKKIFVYLVDHTRSLRFLDYNLDNLRNVKNRQLFIMDENARKYLIELKIVGMVLFLKSL